MSESDRRHWDTRYADLGMAPTELAGPPAFARVEHLFPTEGLALELGCGRGRGAVWLADRGMEVWAVDVSPVAIGLARELALRFGMSHRCRFDVFDLDHGLPAGPPVDLVLCYLFRDERLDAAIIDRLAPGGLVAVVALSEVGAGPGQFRASSGELLRGFGELDILDEGEGEGMARILAASRKPPVG